MPVQYAIRIKETHPTMKVFPTTLNECGEWVHDVGRRVLCKLMLHAEGFHVTDTLAEADVVFAGTPTMDPWKFNRALADEVKRHKKPVIVFNESDGGPPESDNIPFADWVREIDNGIRAYFYREWRKDFDASYLHFPLVTFDLPDYLAAITAKDAWMKKPQSFEEFNSRSINVFHCQSIHVASRAAFHRRVSVVEGDPRWMSSDYYRLRLPFDIMMELQGRSKITVALEGSGVKCMRHCEAGINSVMAMHDFSMMETYPWLNKINCIKLPYRDDGGEYNRGVLDTENAIDCLERWLHNEGGLYNIYVACVENAARYSMPNYISKHIAPTVLQYA